MITGKKLLTTFYSINIVHKVAIELDLPFSQVEELLEEFWTLHGFGRCHNR